MMELRNQEVKHVRLGDDGLYRAIIGIPLYTFLFYDKPDLSPGDKVKITIQKEQANA